MTDGRRWLDKTVDTLRKAGEAARDGVQRTYHVSTLKIEIAALRRTLEDVTREVGRTAVDVLRDEGTLTPERVAPLLRRVDDLEDQIAAKERQIADLEREEAPRPGRDDSSETGEPESTKPRRRPSFGGGDGA